MVLEKLKEVFDVVTELVLPLIAIKQVQQRHGLGFMQTNSMIQINGTLYKIVNVLVVE